VKLLVVGATGKTGRLVLLQGVARGHRITILARRPEVLAGAPGIENVVRGDARDSVAVVRAVTGQDAVISTAPGSGAAQTVIEAMRAAGVRRYIGVGQYPVAATRPRVLLAVIRLFLGKYYTDGKEMERIVRASDLDWTIFRPPRLSNRPATGHSRVGTGDNLPSGPFSMRRGDLATLLLDEAERPSHVRMAVPVSSV
jgi:uncharacterized protein YbjT (DUF2867 family)